MSEIDVQNSRQIRDPMDVLITMTLAADDITMTYSGYSSAKVADGVLDRRNWSMRKLADLQGDGFPLDGTHVLYDSATIASRANGKLGVRSNVGQSVTVTATGNKVMASVTIIVTGAGSVTYGGTTTPITGGSVTIPVLSTSITMTFNPANDTERIEISDIYPDNTFRVTNDNLIKATVSLRSDLSLFDQTLPESELNIEVYHGADVSEDVASIPADTPIIYQAGYEGDMSPARKFYVAGQVTWADNVLIIHAVDAVHFLDDVNIVAPVTEKDSDRFGNAARYVLQRAGVSFSDSSYSASWWSGAYRWIIPENTNARRFLAFLNQCFNITDDDADLLEGSGTLNDVLQFAYIDAGIPTLRTYNSEGPRITIKENDCADVKKDIEPKTGTVNATWRKLITDDATTTEGKIAKVGSATFKKNVGASLNFDQYTYEWKIGLFVGRNYDNDVAKKMLSKYGVFYGWGYMLDVVPGRSTGEEGGGFYDAGISSPRVGDKLLIGEIPQEEYRRYPDPGSIYSFSSFVPWSQPYNGWEYDEVASHLINNATQMWDVLKNADILDATAEAIDLDIYGFAFYTENQVKTYVVDPESRVYEYGEAPIIGRLAAKLLGGSPIEIYPSKMLSIPMYRSNIKGSFTWKGDPRLQPRDRVWFRRLDGSREEVTLETITITHEGGGTSAEMTYRKGAI